MGFADDLIKQKKILEEQMSGNSGSSFADTLIANKQLMNQASTIDTLGGNITPTIDTVTSQLTNAVKKSQPILPQANDMNLGQKVGYVGESFGSGILGGATQMINAPYQNVQEGAERAQNKTATQNIQSLLYKNLLPGNIGRLPDVINDLNTIANDPNIGGWQKALNMAMETANSLSMAGKLEDAGQLYGFAQQLLNRNGAKDIQQGRDLLQTPSNALQKDVTKKGENLNGGWKLAGQVGQATGNMIPSIGLSLLTGDPSSASAQALSLASMGVSAKGQATEEALNKGADLSEANRIGAAKGMVEVGTEKLTGGLSWFGKGPADQIAERIINDNVKNSVANFVLKKIIGGLGEVGEEVISDIAGIAIDKATTDPNANVKDYFKNGDFWNTVITTLLTTGILETGYDVAGKAITGKSAYQINKEELGRIGKVQDMVNEEISNTDTSKMSNKEINDLKSQLETKYTNMLEQGVRDIISQADEEAFYQGKRTGGSELQEVEQQDIKDTANALNLEENVEENIEENTNEEQQETTPTATELELNLENQTQNQTQNNINITTGLEDYIKNNNLTELTQENIDDYINQILEEQQANLTEQERKSLIDEYQDIIKDYAKDNGIPVIEAPKIEIPDMTAESKAPSKAIGRETRNEIKNQVNAFNNAVKSNQYKVGNQVKEQYKNLEQKSINKLDNDALFYNQLEQKKNTSKKSQETSARREYVQPVVQRKADVSTTIGQSYAKTIGDNVRQQKPTLAKNQETGYNKKQRNDFTKALESKEWKAFYKKIDNHGIENKQPGSKNITFVNDKIVLSEHDGTRPNVYDVYQGINTSSDIAKKIGIKTEDIIQDIYEISQEEGIDERKVKENLEKYFDKGLLRRYNSDNNVFVNQNEQTRNDVESNIGNIGEQQGRKTNISKTNQTNRELDNSSFLNEKTIDIPKTTAEVKTAQDKSKNALTDSVKAMNLEKENIKYSIEEKIEKEVRNQYKNLSEDKIQKIIDLKIKQEQKNQLFSNYNNKNRAKQRKMINAYETNAEIRKIVQGDSLQKVKGGLTDTELAKAIKKENSNYIGKKVIVDGQNGTVVGNPYGRVKVEFENGLTKTFDADEVESANKNDVITAKDTKGNKIDLKPTKKGTYERVETPKKTDVMPDMSNDTVTIGDKKVSNFYSNITEKSKFITEDNRASLLDNENLKYYNAITNKDTLLDAMGKLATNAEQQIGDFFAKDSFNAEDMATGWILIKRYQDAGNYEAMSNVIETMRKKGTKSGQAIQMLGMLNRLTPEGMEFYAQRQLDNAYNKFVENKSKKEIDKYAEDFTLTPEEHQFIKDTMEKVEKMTNEDDKKVEVAKIVKMLSDKLPPEKGSRIKAWMRISMLGNPKTQVRNVVGNAIIQPFNWLGDTLASRIDKIMSKKTGIRTKGNTDFGALAGGFVKGAKDAVRDAKLGIDTRDINLDRFEENIGAKPFYEGHKSKALNAGAKVLNKTNQILGNVMSGGDRVFYQAIYDNSLKNQMKLNNVTTPTQEMMQIAEQEALSRTWNDSNEYTKAVLQIRNAMNKLNVKGYGLGDVLVPFAKTPANLTKAIVDYSPVGLVRSILQDGKNYRNSLQNGQYNAQIQHKFADSLGKGFAGTVLWAAAYALAQAGITSGASDDDKDVANFMRNTLGIQPYSVKIGDKSFTYDWAQPIAAPFAAMADAKRLSEKEEKDFGSIVKTAVSSASNILLEQSFLSSIQDVFNSYEGPAAAIKQQIEDLPARATPTFFKQIADLIDPVQRQTYVIGNTGETVKNKVQVKIPGASKELTAQRDTLGREIKKYGGDDNIAQYAFNVFLNPANTNKGKPSAAAEEIYDVYKNTGDKTIMPRQVGYSENIGGTTIPLSAEERNEWQRLSGEKVEESVKTLSSNSKYNSMSYEDKADVINGIVNYSFAKAKSDMFGTQISTTYKTAAKKEAEGMSIADYYVDRVYKRK